MSERKPDEDEVVREANSRPNDDRHALRTWVREARRARASEDQKDAVIKALADALETQMEKPEGEHLRGCPHSLERYRHVAQPCADECVAARNALRLAGRL